VVEPVETTALVVPLLRNIFSGDEIPETTGYVLKNDTGRKGICE